MYIPTIISITQENLDREHICCALMDKKGEMCVDSKKRWLKERLEEGLRFKKMDVRGKAFIEYLPTEKAWVPIEGSLYMHINCFWVSGQYKGKGFSNVLFAECIRDAQKEGFSGLTAISSAKKRPYLLDGAYLKHKGFLVADKAAPFYELLYLPFNPDADRPKFRFCAKNGQINQQEITLYFTNQCPFTEKYAMIFKKVAEKRGVPFQLRKLMSAKDAQNAPAPFTTYSLFYNGQFITNEILSEKKIDAFLKEINLT